MSRPGPQAVVIPLLCLVAGSSAFWYNNVEDVVPGTGYGCDLPCGGGDRDYRIVARVKEIRIPHTANGTSLTSDLVEGLYGNISGDAREDVTFHVRTLEPENPDFSGCFGQNGQEGVLAPCLTMSPGETVYVRIENQFGDADSTLNLRPVPESYAGFARPGSEGPWELDSSIENLPGLDTGFDAEGKSYGYNTFNLHFHGLEVQPHLFFPESTSNPEAPWVTAEPDNFNGQQCYCYRLDVASNQATGTFIYHVHRHGSAAYQGWSGMVGVINMVPGPDHPPTAASQLDDLGIANTNIVVYWDSQLIVDRAQADGLPGRIALADWTSAARNKAQRTQFVNNEATGGSLLFGAEQESAAVRADGSAVTKYLNPGQPTQLSIVCFYVVKTCQSVIYKIDPATSGPTGEPVPILRFASDGIAFEAFENVTAIWTAPGQREQVVVILPEVGEYGLFQEFQSGFSHGLPGTVQFGTFVVSGNPYAGEVTQASLMGMSLIPGKAEDYLANRGISIFREIVFNMQYNKSRVPFLQYSINSKAFDVNRTDIVTGADKGWLEKWTVSNPSSSSHPLHIHVQPFQITKVTFSNDVDISTYPGTAYQESYVKQQLNHWRDTVTLPPQSVVELYTPTGDTGPGDPALVGKSLFHCHYLLHEDRGMMGTMMLSKDRQAVIDGLNKDGYVVRRPSSSNGTAVPSGLSSTSIGLVAAGSSFLALAIVLVIVSAHLRRRSGTVSLPVVPESASASSPPETGSGPRVTASRV